MGVRQDTRDALADRAEKSMESHVLTVSGDNIWECGKPNGSSIYRFWLAAMPHHVAVAGDLGSFCFRVPLKRLISMANDPNYRTSFDYPLSKVSNHALQLNAHKVFSVDEAEELIAYQEKMLDLGFDPAVVRELWDGYSQEDWYTACVEAGDEEPDPCEDWSGPVQYLWHAVRCFARLFTAGVPG